MYVSLDDNIVTLPLLLPQETTFEHRQNVLSIGQLKGARLNSGHGLVVTVAVNSS
jgi:hypothetical protein